jgi:nuclear pore complex protein Nup62
VHGAPNLPICATLSPTSKFVTLRPLAIFDSRKKSNDFRRAVAKVCHLLRVKDICVWKTPLLLMKLPVMDKTNVCSLFVRRDVCMYIYVCMYVCVYVCIDEYVYVYVRTWACTRVCTLLCVHMYICMCMDICKYTYLYVCMYACRPMCVCV